MNFLIWIIIIVAGFISTLIAWVEYGPDAGIPMLFSFAGGAWAWYSIWAWWHGLRRVAKQHLKKRFQFRAGVKLIVDIRKPR